MFPRRKKPGNNSTETTCRLETYKSYNILYTSHSMQLINIYIADILPGVGISVKPQTYVPLTQRADMDISVTSALARN